MTEETQGGGPLKAVTSILFPWLAFFCSLRDARSVQELNVAPVSAEQLFLTPSSLLSQVA